MNTEIHEFKSGDRVRWKGNDRLAPWKGWCIGRGEYDMPLVILDGQRVARRFWDEQLEYASPKAKPLYQQLSEIAISRGSTA